MLLTDTLFYLILTIILLQKALKNQVQVQVTLGAFSYLPPFLIIHGNSLSENRAAIMDRWLKKLDGPSTTATQMCSSSLLASYEVSLLVAKSKKPYSIAEELIVPAAAILTETMLDKKAAKAIKTVPLSNDTVCRRIDDMAEDIVAQVVGNLKQTSSFALQLDESTDISGESQLVAFVRYKDTDDIREHILFCKPMLGKTTGEDIFNVMCSHIYTDGAASMTGWIQGFVSRVKQVHPGIKTMHCIIHREALASKRLSPKLNEVLNDAVKIINFIKSRPLNHHQLLLHTDVRWLSRGKTLQRLFELREQVGDFLSEHLHPLSALLKDFNWLAHLAYLADIFSRLNELNLELQGTDTSVLHMYDRVSSFMKKIDLWRRKCQDGDLSSFPRLNSCILNGGADKEPFVATSIETAPVSLQERLIDLSSDRGLKIMFSETPLTKFWCSVEKEYPDVGKCALYELLPFGSTYLCEATFSAMANIKTKQRNRLNLERSLIAAVATLHPRMQNLIRDKQVQISH
uniref:HAT C-terminal dimerisation domain-containing protein n=1 Tax=Sinocyclocheilus anshuiensis TaxID=1608454 RepID=A0A671KL09_9TELE